MKVHKDAGQKVVQLLAKPQPPSIKSESSQPNPKLHGTSKTAQANV